VKAVRSKDGVWKEKISELKDESVDSSSQQPEQRWMYAAQIQHNECPRYRQHNW